MPSLEWPKEHSFLTVLEGEKSKIIWQQIQFLLRVFFLGYSGQLLTALTWHRAEVGRILYLFLFV
jgi:hypothetical protein